MNNNLANYNLINSTAAQKYNSAVHNPNIYSNAITKPIDSNIKIFNHIRSKLDSAQNIAIYPHKKPDSDAIASSILLKKALKQIYPNKIIDIIINDEIPYETRKLHDLDNVKLRDSNININAYDVAFALDMSAPDIIPDPVTYNNSRFKVNIDHHKSNSHINGATAFADVAVVDPNFSSTSQVIYEKFLKNYPELDLTKDMAREVMLGVLTDTAELTSKSVNSTTYKTINELVTKANINFQKIYSDVKSSANIQAKDLPMFFDLVNNVKYKGSTAFTIVNNKFLIQNDAHKKVINRAVADLLKREGVDVSAIFYKTDEGIKVVFRSKHTDVSQIANKLGGGGHENSSGAIINASMKDAVKQVLSLV